MMVDTLTIARELKAADLPAAIAAAIGRSISEGSATKADLEAVRLGLKADIESVRQDLKSDVATVRVEIEKVRADMERIPNQLLTYIISAMVALGSLIVAVVKL